jgi:hypothetical protein
MSRSVVIAGFATAALLLSAVAEAQVDKVLGSGNTADFSSYLLQAQVSKARIIGLANAGSDMINTIKQACEGDKPYGDVEYADPGYQDDKKKRYPIDTEKHVRAAWSYINKPKNAGKYSADELTRIKNKIIAAWKDKIDPEGPPSAAPPR